MINDLSEPYLALRTCSIFKGEEDIIYAVDYNHKKEIHLNGAVLETLSRPALLITDAYTALNTHTYKRKDRDLELMNTILSAVRKDGNVLLAVDTAGRVLELAQVWYLVDQDPLTYYKKKHMNPSPKTNNQ